ncbi:MAG TPA: 23S rRNA (uracil(1939)-C(5))-methyltransferase RlmD [Pseudomonadales bacterium]|nr:23S rRNA (uracil(1939)-C(5))-methyltransferase RlmD [Pseudomonadales bacterium]
MTVLEVTRIAHDLRGVAHADGSTWFVEGALPGEQVSASVLMRRSQLVDAVAVDVIANPSPDRVKPSCEYSGRCGGCALQHVDSAAQVRLKQQVLLDQLQRLGRIAPHAVLSPLVVEPWAYRRRARFACKWSSDRKHLAFGLRERHSERIVEVEHCAVLLPALEALVRPLRAVLSGWSQPRLLGHVECLSGDNGVAILVRLLGEPSCSDYGLLREFSRNSNTSIFLKVGGTQSEDQSPTVFFCGKEAVIEYAHEPTQTHVACFPGDFVQGNEAVNRQLTDAVLESLQTEITDTVLEAFCGLGNFTFPLARRVQRITALELSNTMLARAKRQADALAVDNIHWHASNLDRFSTQEKSCSPVNKILLDPPREGAQDFCKSVSLQGVCRLVYVSCNPSTLARDAAILAERGFLMESVRIVDMFPQTNHIEAIAVFVPDTMAGKKITANKKQAVKNSERKLRR